jgi:hypothetical protein
MKFCPLVPEICCGQIHVPKKERRIKRRRIIIIKIIIIIRNGAKTISCELETCSWGGVLDTTSCDKVCQ